VIDKIGAALFLVLGLFFLVASFYTFGLDLDGARQMLVGGGELFLAILFFAAAKALWRRAG
jgi:hypothetical protein